MRIRLALSLLCVLSALTGGLALVACGKTTPAPPAGQGIRAPVVAADLPADLTFRWPTPARARVTMRTTGKAMDAALVSDLVLEPPDAQGNRRLRQTDWEPLGGTAAGLLATAMNDHAEDGLLIRGDGELVDEAKGLWWTRWVGIWSGYGEVSATEPTLVPAGGSDSLPGVDFELSRLGASPVDPHAVRLRYRMTAVDAIGRQALSDMLVLSQRSQRRRGQPVELTSTADIDPRTLQPLRVDLVTRLEQADGELAIVFEFDWTP